MLFFTLKLTRNAMIDGKPIFNEMKLFIKDKKLYRKGVSSRAVSLFYLCHRTNIHEENISKNDVNISK